MASFCINCAAALEPGVKFCASCGVPVEPSAPAATVSAEVASAPSVERGRRYPALRIIAVILKVFAAVAVVAGVISGLSLASIQSSFGPAFGGSAMALFGVLGGLGYGLFLWASAEMIDVLIDIEENTRRAIPSR